MKIGTLTIALLAVAASHAFAAPVSYELNKDHTDITFQISHAGFTMKHGSFADMSGTLNLDADHLDASSADISPLSSVQRNSRCETQDIDLTYILYGCSSDVH
jgi:polyisoprenoid-binding protein YceI